MSTNYLDLKVQRLLHLHDEAAAGTKETISQVFGDGFLYQTNKIYNRIRKKFLASGFTITDTDFCHYVVLPYASLTQILQAKKIPYSDNVTVFRDIEKQRSGHFCIGDIPKVKSNYLLHEASHCIADSVLETNDFNFKNHFSDPEQAILFPYLLMESFANSTESFANAFSTSAEEKLFYDLNSYVTHSKKVDSQLRYCLETFGEKDTFTLIYISYLCANLLIPEQSTKQLLQLLVAAGLSEAVTKKMLESPKAKGLFAHGYELNLDFRLQTTGFFCALIGLKSPLEKLIAIDLVTVLKKTKCVQKFLSCTHFLFDKFEANS